MGSAGKTFSFEKPNFINKIDDLLWGWIYHVLIRVMELNYAL